MTHIRESEPFRYPWYMRIVFFFQRRRYGRALEPVRLWGRIPGAYPGMALLYRALTRKDSPLDPALRSLVQVLISQLNSCAFCIDLNSHLSLTHGAPVSKLHSLADFERSAVFTEQEKAALRYARAVTSGERIVEETTLARLREYFDDQAIVELTGLIAFQNMSSKFNTALGVPAHGFCALPGQTSDAVTK